MIAYMYNIDTMEYAGEINCYLDPIASARVGDKIYILPANSTYKSPPIYDTSTQIPIYDNSDWQIVNIQKESDSTIYPTDALPTEFDQVKADIDLILAYLGLPY